MPQMHPLPWVSVYLVTLLVGLSLLSYLYFLTWSVRSYRSYPRSAFKGWGW